MRASRLQRATRHASAVATRVMTRGYQVPARDMRFLIYDVHKFDKHYTTLKHAAAADRETIDMVIDATKTLCENELAPIWANGDREGCTWINGTTVKTPKGYKEAYELFCESGWQGLAYPEEWGGQGLPMSMALIQSEMTATGFSVRMRQNICHASVRQGTRRNTECLVDAQMSRVLLV